MPRHVFYSFHYQPDNWRVSTIRNIGAIEGNRAAHDNDWEQIKAGGDRAIERWIEGQMRGKSCVVVLVGADTSGRKWINYEISKAWELGKGIVGVHIHQLLDRHGRSTFMGDNPFGHLAINRVPMSDIVECHNPRGNSSQEVYRDIADNIAGWIDRAIEIRKAY